LGRITAEFADVVRHVKTLRNVGAHFKPTEKVTKGDALVAMKFTAQLLRNLYELPGELAMLRVAPTPSQGDA
jgi:hypothetical protein